MDLWVLSFTPLRGPQGIYLLSTVVRRLEYRKNSCGPTFSEGQGRTVLKFPYCSFLCWSVKLTACVTDWPPGVG